MIHILVIDKKVTTSPSLLLLKSAFLNNAGPVVGIEEARKLWDQLQESGQLKQSGIEFRLYQNVEHPVKQMFYVVHLHNFRIESIQHFYNLKDAQIQFSAIICELDSAASEQDEELSLKESYWESGEDQVFIKQMTDLTF